MAVHFKIKQSYWKFIDISQVISKKYVYTWSYKTWFYVRFIFNKTKITDVILQLTKQMKYLQHVSKNRTDQCKAFMQILF